MLPWVLLLPALKRLLPLPRLARLMWAAPAASRRADADDVLALAGMLTHYRPLPSRGNCLERSLLAYRYLARAGLEPSLIVGVAGSDGGGLAGHAWVELAGVPLREPEGVERFTRVVAFVSEGRMRFETSDASMPSASSID
jgi:hypothetical protein